VIQSIDLFFPSSELTRKAKTMNESQFRRAFRAIVLVAIVLFGAVSVSQAAVCKHCGATIVESSTGTFTTQTIAPAPEVAAAPPEETKTSFIDKMKSKRAAMKSRRQAKKEERFFAREAREAEALGKVGFD